MLLKSFTNACMSFFILFLNIGSVSLLKRLDSFTNSWSKFIFFKALNESVALCDSIPRNNIHDELSASIGGGA